jgi:hypothetical protein
MDHPVNFRTHVNPMTKEVLDFAGEREEVKPTMSRIEVDQKIDVALGSRVASCHGAEYPDSRYTSPTSEAENLVSVRAYQSETRRLITLRRFPDVHDAHGTCPTPGVERDD